MSVSIGDQVRLVRPQTFLKTADPMPMLRPPDLVAHDEVGRVMALHPAGVAAVRFTRGTFLLSFEQLMLVTEEPELASDPEVPAEPSSVADADSGSDTSSV